MTDHQADDPPMPGTGDAAEKSEAANIADESASYTNALKRQREEQSKPQSIDDRAEADDE